MPYPDKISNGETVELRMTILPEGNYANTLYTIRVLLESKEFRLNYTAKSADSQEIYICIEDNYGTRWEQTFEFNNSDGDGGSGSLVVTPINPGTITPINY